MFVTLASILLLLSAMMLLRAIAPTAVNPAVRPVKRKTRKKSVKSEIDGPFVVPRRESFRSVLWVRSLRITVSINNEGVQICLVIFAKHADAIINSEKRN